LGRVRGINREIFTSNGQVRKVKGKILNPRKSSQCVYYMVGLCREGSSRNYYIHRLVAEAFIPNPTGLPEINHIDGDHSNNRVDNLEWCSHTQNTVHKIYVLRKGGAKKVMNNIGQI
jgi:hypothetical protein